MATNNAVNASFPSFPVSVSQGGTGLTTIGADGVLYGNGTSAIGVTAAGTAGQLLTSNGAGVAPTFQATTTANFVLIQSLTASSSANLSFTTGITSTFNTYFLVWSAVVPATNTAVLQLFLSTNGGVSYITTGYTSGINFAAYTTASLSNANSTTAIILSGALSNTASIGANGTAYLYNMTNGANMCMSGFTNYNGSTSGAGAYGILTSGSGTTDVNALQLSMSSGDIATGKVSLYGILE